MNARELILDQGLKVRIFENFQKYLFGGVSLKQAQIQEQALAKVKTYSLIKNAIWNCVLFEKNS